MSALRPAIAIRGELHLHEWMHAWMAFDPDAVRRDYMRPRRARLDHVRILPLWTVLQPNRTLIRQQAVDDVRAAVDIAAEFGMDASVDIIQGHLSSFDFIPRGCRPGTTRTCSPTRRRSADRSPWSRRSAPGSRMPGFLGFTLGNETNQFAAHNHPSPWPVTPAEAASWITTLLDAAELLIYNSFDAKVNRKFSISSVFYKN